MNCENCKNKKATVFYADDAGGRHSLCTACGTALGKISAYDPIDAPTHTTTSFLPSPTLFAFTKEDISLHIFCSAEEDQMRSACKVCSTSLEEIVRSGRFGCTECYASFSDSLFPSSLTLDNAKGMRMPSSRRDRLDRARLISDMRLKIKVAVEKENYELAATLRDEIRKLEAQKSR